MRTGVVVALLLFARTGEPEQTLQKIAWSTPLPDGARIEADGSLTVTSARDEGLTLTIAEVDEPGITKQRYAVKGRVRYKDVAGKGYVEMWSVFPDGRYFTRTLADGGPMGALAGSSDGRPIILPFDSTSAPSPPQGLIVNVVLPGRGEVTLSPMTLVELEAGDWPSSTSGAVYGMWGVWGGLGGALLGIVAGLLGWLGGLGKARSLVLTGFRAIMILGAAALVAGLVALLKGQGYDVYYPLLLIGVLSLLVPLTVLPRLRKRYEELELRRMSALDA